MLARCDAALFDRRCRVQVALEDYDTTDLVEAWVRGKNKPFVCAFWAAGKTRRFPLIDPFFWKPEMGLKKHIHGQMLDCTMPRRLNTAGAVSIGKLIYPNHLLSFESAHIEGLDIAKF